MTTSTESPGAAPMDPNGSDRPSVLERVFGNRFVLLGLLLSLLGWVAVTRVWLFVLIIAIVASVFLHEMGHFLMAKRNGMKVTEFFIGFGPRVWSFRRGETEYGIKLVPAATSASSACMASRRSTPPTTRAAPIDHSRTGDACPWSSPDRS